MESLALRFLKMSTTQSYKRARKLKRTTSRGRNENWYRHAIEQGEQLHYILVDDHTLYLYHLDRASLELTALGEFSRVVLIHDELREQHIAQILGMVTISPKTGIGIVLHHLNDYVLREGRHKYDDLSYEEINELLLTSSEEILDDPNASDMDQAKRAIPLGKKHKELSHYLVANVNNSYEEFLQKWRDLGNAQNLPINTQVFISPPITAHYLSRLAMVEQANADEAKPKELFGKKSSKKSGQEDAKNYFILSVSKQTSFLAFYSDGEPIYYRFLNHFGDNLPNQLAQTIQNSVVQVEAESYGFFYAFTTNDRGANVQLKRQLSFLEKEPVELDWNAQEVGYLELASVADYLNESAAYPASLVQSYVDYDPEEIASFPTHKEMKLLNVTDLIKLGAVAAAIMLVGLQGFQIYRAVSDKSWNADMNKNTILNATLTKYNSTKRDMEREESLLEDRSKSWEALEFLVRGFSFSEGLMVKNYDYEILPINSDVAGQVGLVRTWTISGNANDIGKERLGVISSKDEMSALFKEMELPSYEPEGEFRNLIVDIQVSSKGRETTNAHPHAFSASITQRIEPQDPLALKVQ